MASGQVQDAKARFSELLDATIKEGPQTVTRRGVEAVVLMPIQEWKRLQQAAGPGLKALLLDPGNHFAPPILHRGASQRSSLGRCRYSVR